MPQQQSSTQKKLLTSTFKHGSKGTRTGQTGCVIFWRHGCCHPSVCSELDPDKGQPWRSRRHGCNLSQPDKRQKVPPRKTATAATRAPCGFFGMTEKPSDPSGDAAVSPDVHSSAFSCTAAPQPARSADDAGDDILSAEELLRVLRGIRKSSCSLPAARSGGCFQPKSGSLSAVHRFPSGGSGATCVRESRSLSNDKEDFRRGPSSSPPQLVPASHKLSRSCEAAYYFSQSLSSESTSTSCACADTAEHLTNAGIPQDISTVPLRKTSPSLKIPFEFWSHRLRHSCLYRSLLYHLRRQSPGCYSTLHLYAVSRLPVEPLLPDLPQLVLKLLKANAFSTTKELVLCVHACTTLLGDSSVKSVQSVDATRSARIRSGENSLTDQTATCNTLEDVWSSLCLAFETAFCERLRQQFEHTYEYLQRLKTSEELQWNSDRLTETVSRTQRKRDRYGLLLAGTSEPRNASADECHTASARGAASVRRGDTACRYRVPTYTWLHCTMETRTDLSPAQHDEISVSEPRCSTVSLCLDRSAPAEAVSSESCTHGVFFAVDALETAAPAKPSNYFGSEAQRMLNRPSSILTAEKVEAKLGKSKEESPSSFHKAKEGVCHGQIPSPHVVVPQDLSMFVSSYIALAKRSKCPVSECFIAAAACYFFLYSGHSSPQAFTLGTSIVAKVAATLLAGNAASCVLSHSGAAPSSQGTPCQHVGSVFLSPYLGPFTSDVTVLGSSVAGQCVHRAEQLEAVSETPYTHTRLRYAPRSSGPPGDGSSPVEGRGEKCRRRAELPRQFLARNYLSPMQLLAAGLHHWVVEKASALRSHDWVCVLQALRYFLRLRSASRSLIPPSLGGTQLEAPYTKVDVESPDMHPLDALFRKESNLAFSDRSTRTSSSKKNRFSIFSTPDRSSHPLTDHNDAFALPKEYAQHSGTNSETESLDLALVEENTQLQGLNHDYNCYVRRRAQASSAAALRAAQRTIAAAAVALFSAPSLKYLFSALAAAIPSFSPSHRRGTQQIFDRSQTLKDGSGLPRYGHGSQKQAYSGTPAKVAPTMLRASTSFPASFSPAGGATLTANHCSHVRDTEFEFAKTGGAAHDGLQVYVPAVPIAMPSAVGFLHAVRQVLVPLQHRFHAAVTLASVPVLTLAAVQLHGALLEKVRALQAPVANCKRGHDMVSEVGSGCRRSTQGAQVMQGVPVSDVTRPRKSTEPEASGAQMFNCSTLSTAHSVSAILAPVYELLCGTYEAGLVSGTLPVKGESRLSGCIILLSALVDALHLVAVECSYQRSANLTPTAGRLAQSDDVPDTARLSAVIPSFGSSQFNSAVYDEVECFRKRLQSAVLRLFQHAISNVFLQKSVPAGFSIRRDGSEAARVFFDATHVTPERRDSADGAFSTVNENGPAAQTLDTTTSCPSHPRLAWCPKPQDLVDLVKAASFLVSPSALLDGCDKRFKVPFHSYTEAGPSNDEPLAKSVLSYPDALDVTADEKGRVAAPPPSVSSTPSTIENDERHHMMLLLRACCFHVVNVLEHQVGQPRKSKSKMDGRPEKSIHGEEKSRSILLPRDVSSLALHFYRCDLLSSAEFEAFGRYIIAGGQEHGLNFVPFSTVVTGHDFVCLLHIFVRPDISETYRRQVTCEERQVPAQFRAQRSAWQTPFAVRLAVFMLDGMLPRHVRTFDELALAKLTLWLGTQFQKLQVYDRCNRSTSHGENRNPDGCTAGYPRGSGRCSVHTPIPMRAQDATVTARVPCRLQLPVMRGMLERAARHVVRELLVRFCGVQLNCIPALSEDHAHASKQSSIRDFSAELAAERSSRYEPTTASSAPPGSHQVIPEASPPHVSCPRRFGNSGKVCEDADAYVTLLLGLSKLPRDLVLLSGSQITFNSGMDHGDGRKNNTVTSEQPGQPAAQGCRGAGRPLEAHLPPGMLLLRSLLSRHQLQLFFAPRVALTDWQLKTFFAALQHLPLTNESNRLSKAATVAADKCSSIIEHGEHGLPATDCLKLRNSDCTVNSFSLKEHALHTVFQASSYSGDFW